MVDDYNFNVKKIDTSKEFTKRNKPQQKKNKRTKESPKNDALGHFEELSQLTERVNAVLEAKKSPYRFCIYRDKNEIFFDLVMLDQDNKIKETRKKNITHQEFSTIIEHIEKLDGLLIDYVI